MSHGLSSDTPFEECRISEGFECASGDEVALEVEAVVDHGVDREKSLRRSWPLEADPRSLSPSHWLMGIFSTLVSSWLGQNVVYLAFSIDSAPQMYPAPADRNEGAVTAIRWYQRSLPTSLFR